MRIEGFCSVGDSDAGGFGRERVSALLVGSYKWRNRRTYSYRGHLGWFMSCHVMSWHVGKMVVGNGWTWWLSGKKPCIQGGDGDCGDKIADKVTYLNRESVKVVTKYI